MSHYFQDFVPVKNAHVDENGILRVPATIGRVGIQEYINAKGELKKRLRPESEVEKSAPTFSRQVITLDHPPREFVNSGNAAKYLKGLSSDCIYSRGLLDTIATITHKDAVIAALSTHKQLSCGYWADIEETSGDWVDEFGVMGEVGKSYEYDEIQRNIRGNHIALVPRGRAGEIASIHDEADEIYLDNALAIIDHLKTLKRNMVQIIHKNQILTLDGDDADKVKTLIEQLTSEIEQTETKLKDAIAAKETLKTEKLALEGKVIGLEQKANQSKDSSEIDSEIKARLEAWSEVKSHLKNTDSIDYSLDVTAIHKAYLMDAHPELKAKLEAAEPAFIDGMYVALQPKVTSKTDSFKSAIDGAVPTNDGMTALEKARKKAVADKEKAWRNK